MSDLLAAIETPAPVPLSTMLEDVENLLRRYVVLTDAQATVLALWVAHTHAIDASETTPYMAVTSAEKRSGKTRLLEVLELLVRAAVRAANVSDAALFRILAENPRTLLFDEVDAIFNAKSNREDLRALLNAGYRRGSPTYRVVGEGGKMRVEPFESFGPKVLAGIGMLPDTIADRAFLIRLKRKTIAENVQRFRGREAQAAAVPIRGQLEVWSRDEIAALDDVRPKIPSELDDRAQDAAEPLLAIAEVAGGDWPARARKALVALRAEGARAGDETIGVRLLADVRAAFKRAKVAQLTTEHLLELLTADEEAPWSDWYGKPLSPMKFARLLRPFDVRSRALRIGDRAGVRGYRLEDFEDAFARYLSPENATQDATPATTAEPCGFEGDSKTQHDPSMLHLENGRFPLSHAVVAGVASPTRFEGDEQAADTCPHPVLWLARDGLRRCMSCEPPAFPSEIVDEAAMA